MENPLLFLFARRRCAHVLTALLTLGSGAYPIRAQETPAKTEAQTPPAAQAPATDNAEMSTRDTPPTFRVRVNLVLVRVVVRDGTGKVVTNLKKEDFQLSDNRKPQVISTFSVETPESHKVAPTTTPADSGAATNTS